MTGHKPKDWSKRLPLAEWWYNSNYHTSLHTSPFKALYGYNPPHLAFPLEVTTSVADVEDYIKERDKIISMLKESVKKSQERMKYFADMKRTDKSFRLDDMVYLKLQPYRQTSMAVKRNQKLSARLASIPNLKPSQHQNMPGVVKK